MEPETETRIESEVCGTCKSFSSWSGCANGFCLKKKRPTDSTGTCGQYRPDVKVRYAMECKPYERSSRPPASMLSD